MSKVDRPVRYEDNPRPVVDCSGDENLTQQHAAAECDMNVIMERATRGAVNSHLNPVAPVYGSLIGMGDLRDAMNLVVKANQMFMDLDPFLRKRFDNDPAKLLDFVSDDKNRDEAQRLGLLKVVEPPKADEHLDTLRSIDKSLKAGGKHGRKADSEPED